MPLITQLALGALWTELFGFSQGALRQLTLSLALISCITVFLCVRYLDIKSSLCMLCALLPLSSPMFVGLSYSFMTDIPAITLVMLASLFFIRSFKEPDDVRYYTCGTIFLFLAVLLRQTSVALALALIVAEPVAKGYSLRRLIRSVIVLFSTIALYLIATEFLESFAGLPRAYGAKTDALFSFVSDVLAANFGVFRKTIEAIIFAVSQFGLFVLPLLPIFLGIMFRHGARQMVIPVTGAILLLLGSIVFEAGVLFRGGGNILTADGIGPRAIGGEVPAESLFAWAITAVSHFSFLSAVMAGTLAIRKSSQDFGNERFIFGSLLFFGLTAIITFAPHTIAYAPLFDRYTLLPSILLNLCIIFVIKDTNISKLEISLSALCIFIGFFISIGLTADFFRWQDARYKLIGNLATMGFSVAEIDGGFEFNNLTAVLSDPQNAVSMSLVNPEGRSVRLTQNVGPNDEVIASENYTHFLRLHTGAVYAVR
ncbi:MAG: glycosyltransferase family 39 protein [Pseudomonadota bacterium]